MDNNLENNDWKKEAPTLAALPVDHSFSVPEGYFEHLPLQITNAIYLEKLKAKVADTDFSTPEGYFEELGGQINAEILTERLKVIAPLAEQNTAVPANYFEKLQANILSKTVDEPVKSQPTKIVSLWHSNILKYASAACFVILSAAGLYFYAQNHPGTRFAYTDSSTEQMLYDIDEQVIIDHIEANGLQEPKPAAKDVALENYILNNYSQSDIALNL
ncbi:hypothetical protein [Pedobacter nyackensis]|uniref:hypothetical protein n=1 Tax=Pedobacter nyackensis TaxID=475255 RepID=UPI002930EEC9|nr:hypothetical protein [Pedobacter nyackensis]